MTFGRIRFISLVFSRLKCLWFVLKKDGLKGAFNYLWVHAFTRDSGLALMDPLYRKFKFFVSYPETIELEITTRCHLKCTMCEHTYWNEPPADMSLDGFKTIINQFPSLKWLGITGIGSNFLNKDFLSMLRYAKSKSVFVEFFDTFDLINEQNARELIKIGVNKIWMSIDGATKETYDKIRVGTSFEKVMSNLNRLMELKKEYRSPFPEVWFHYIVSNANYKELPRFIRLIHPITKNANNPATMVYFSGILNFKEIDAMQVQLPDQIIMETEKIAKETGIYIAWNPSMKPVRSVRDCTRWTEPFILSTGHVQPCCAINEANNRQYQKEKSLGNLLQTDFHSIWGKDYKKLIREIHQNKLPEICKYCRAFIHE